MNLTKIAKIISYAFVPPFMNLIIFTIFSIHYENSPQNFISILISLLFGVIFPIYIFIKMRKKGKIINDDATIKEERTIPYIYGIFFTLTGVVVTSLLHLNVYITMLWMAYLINSILLININHVWKISAHTMGVGIPLGASIFFGNIYFYIFITILLLVSFARYKLKVHTISQILAGAFVGSITTFVLMNYLL